MNSTPFIRICDLTKTFIMGRQKVHALAGLNLEIEKNTFTVIMGPSGSGKSTLLYLIGGLDRPTSGSIAIDGVQVGAMDENDLAVYRRQTIGFIFQSFNLMPTLTALENVEFPLRFAAVEARARSARALKMLQEVGLEPRKQHRPTELSGGQQQRVAVARALVNNPPLILADEPTGNLDTISGLGIMQLLSELHRGGRTILVVTHDPRMLHFATRVIYLLDGRSVSEGEYQAASEMISLKQTEVKSTL